MTFEGFARRRLGPNYRLLLCLPQPSPENTSPLHKNEGKEESSLKEEDKKEASDIVATDEKNEGSKEETKQNTEVKEEKSGTDNSLEFKLV